MAILVATLVIMGISSTLAFGIDYTNYKDNLEPEKIVFHPTYNTPQIMSGHFRVSSAIGKEAQAYDFFTGQSSLYKISNPVQELSLIKDVTDDIGMTHLRFQQNYLNLPVWGCQTIVHFREDGAIYLIGGQTIPTPNIETDPGIDESSARQGAISSFKDTELPGQIETSSELLIYPNDGFPRLAWLITITSPINGSVRWQVFVDAQTGAILHKYNDIHFDGPDIGSGWDALGSNRTFPIYYRDGVYQMIDVTRTMYQPPVDNLEGVIVAYDNYYHSGPISTDPNGDKIWDDNTDLAIEVSGYYNAMLTYEYYYNTFGRNSIDDLGMTILVNLHDPVFVNNAYWNGEGINFADGDGVNFLPFAAALDIVAHELTHGVTQFTASLIYEYASGALNEHYSDFFGAMVDRDDWLMGDDITLFSPGCIRSLEDPTLRGHPKHMDQYNYLPFDQDNGGVHINCGIPSHAAYWACNFIGREKAEQIWYRTLTNYLTPASDFYFWAGMTMQSTKDLYGTNEIDSINAALDSVGLNSTYATPYIVQVGAIIGEVGNTSVFVYNPGPGTKQVTVTPPSVPGVTINPGPGYQEYIPEDGYSEFIMTVDATELGECNVGSNQDSLEFNVFGSINSQIIIPMIATVGYTTISSVQADIETSCLTSSINNTAAMTELESYSADLLGRGSLMIGWYEEGVTEAYRDIFGTRKFSPVDVIIEGDMERSIRIASYDARIQGNVTYRYAEDIGDTCDFIIADYTFYNPCNSPATVYSGTLFDFDISVTTDYGDYDTEADMIYLYDEGDNTACGLALLNGEAYNLRTLRNEDILENGFTDEVAYGQLAAGFNLDGYEPDDWSILLSFGQDEINPGDTITYTVAIMHSVSGTAGLADVLAKAEAWYNRVPYICGDANGDTNVNIGDVVYLVNLIFHNGPSPEPQAAGDVNCDGSVNIGDAVYMANYVFQQDAPVPCADCPVK